MNLYSSEELHAFCGHFITPETWERKEQELQKPTSHTEAHTTMAYTSKGRERGRYPIVPAPSIEETILSSMEWSWQTIDHICKSLVLDFQFYVIDLYVCPYASITVF